MKRKEEKKRREKEKNRLYKLFIRLVYIFIYSFLLFNQMVNTVETKGGIIR